MAKDGTSRGGQIVGDDHGNVEALHVRQRRPKAPPPSYPGELKAFSLEILNAYRKTLGKMTARKTVGWTVVRNLIMEAEDADHPTGFDPRLTRDDLEAWSRGISTPSDAKFYFIDRFIKRKEIAGEFDDIRRELSEIRQAYRRTLFDRILSSPYDFSGRHTKTYSSLVKQLSGSFWISDESPFLRMKKYVFYIGEIENNTFNVRAMYFPYALDIEGEILDLHSVFVVGGVLSIDSLKGNRPEEDNKHHTIYAFGESLSVLMFRNENRGGEDASLITGELTLNSSDSDQIFVRWSRSIVAPTLIDYARQVGVPVQTIPDKDNPAYEFGDGIKSLEHPIAAAKGSGMYLGHLYRIKNKEKISEIRQLFEKFED